MTSNALAQPATALRRARHGVSRYGILVALSALIVVVQTQNSHFLDWQNLANISEQWAPVAVMALGMTFVLIGGGFDLSVGATYAFSAVLSASLLQHHSAATAVLASLGLGLAVGLVNGILVTRFNVNALIATLGMGQIVRGFALVHSDGDSYSTGNAFFDTIGSGEVGGIPVPFLIVAVASVLLAVVLARSAWGRTVYAVGGNAEASWLAGVRVDAVRIGTYLLSGACAAIAGMLYVGRVGSGQANIGSGIELQVIAAVLIGGVSILGGEGAVWRAVAGVCVLAVLQNFFNQANVNGFWQSIVQGAIIIAAVGVDSYGKRAHQRPLRLLLAGRGVTARRAVASDAEPDPGPAVASPATAAAAVLVAVAVAPSIARAGRPDPVTANGPRAGAP